ncbi:MAG: RpiB/LacA/LacB family sugar-phosphate isomerase [Actinomycetota bacterium]|nr:MAG: RpiB/LacA/LacB family sugar-phosphate isomerase [Actinomycetota bacterium]
MKIAVGCDEIAIDLKEALIEVCKDKGIEYRDFGVKSAEPVDYPDIAATVTKEVQNGNFDRGILVCGTGIGMALVANKFKGIRAACCHDIYSTQRSILSNDCQMITMGSLVIGKNTAQELLKIWLDIERTGGTVKKVKKIEALEN